LAGPAWRALVGSRSRIEVPQQDRHGTWGGDMMRSVLRGAVVALLLLGLAVPLAAQTTSGSLQGTVKDAQGAVLPGVAVTAFSDALVAGKMTAYTDERGVYRFPSLPVGMYAIEAELAGFVKVRQEDVRLRLGGSLAIDITLPQAKVAEAITVSAEAPVVSVVSNSVSTNFDTQFIDRQPLPRNYYNIIKAAPGVNLDYTGTSGSAMLAYGGNGERQNAYTLDGVNVADAAAGEHWVLPSIQWMQEIQIGGLGANAEYGGYTGGVINGVTKSGGNVFHGTAEYYYEPASWVSNNDPTAEQPETKFSDAALSLGGKVVEDKLWYFISGEYWHQVTTPVGAVATSDRHIPRFLGKLTLQATPDNRLSFMGEYDHVVNDRRGIDVYTLPDATSKQDGPGVSFALNWENLLNANNFINVKFTGYDGRDDYLPYHGHNTPGRIDDDTGVAWVNQDIQELNHRHIMTADASWSLFADGLLGGKDSHSFKFGAVYENATSSDQWLRNGGFTYYDYSGDCDSLEAYFADPTCGPYYVERGWGEYNEYPKFSGLHFYAQDSLRLERLTLNVGLRYGSYRGGWQSGHGTSTVYDVNFVDPRIGFVWDVFGNARTALKAHWGRYHEKAFTYLWDREASGMAVIPDQDCYWDYDTNDYTDCDPIATIRARMGKVNQPYVDESLLTFEQQLSRDMSIGVDFIDRRFRDFMAMMNTNPDYEAYTATGNPYGGGDIPIYDLLSQQDWVLTTDNPAYRNFRSAVVRFEKRYSHGWQLRSSLVWSDLKGNINSNDGYSWEFSDINGQFNADGTMDMAFSKWEFKLNGAVDLPLNFQFSGQYTYLTGWYWTPYVRVRNLDYNAYTGRYINLTPRGSEQLPNRSLIDLRLAWTAKLSNALNLTASLECFNCQNKATVLNVSQRWGDYRLGSSSPWRPNSSFGEATQIENPREIRAGIRLEF
jgi:hypothetical protein